MCTRANVDFVWIRIAFFSLRCVKTGNAFEKYPIFVCQPVFPCMDGSCVFCFLAIRSIIAELAPTNTHTLAHPPVHTIKCRCAFVQVNSLWCLWTWQFIFSINFTGCFLFLVPSSRVQTHWMCIYSIHYHFSTDITYVLQCQPIY